jgi:hypothetical protein
VPDDKLVIVAAASENHARPLFHLLESLDRHERGTKVVLYDLGLAPATRAKLERQGRDVTAFRFDDYPPHVDADNLRTYAWKPAVIHQAMRAHGLPLLYLDAGDLVHQRLDGLRAEIARIGFYSPSGGKKIRLWCHPAAARALELEPEILDARGHNAAIVGFGDNDLGRALIQAWYQAAMNPAIICPPGATKMNHRFDQAILSVLLARAIRDRGLATAKGRLLGVSYHNDSLSARDARRYMRGAPVAGRAADLQRAVAKQSPLNRLTRAAKRIVRKVKRTIAPD